MLMAVALAQVLASAIGPAGWLLSMTGRQTSQLRSYIAALAVQAALAFWLTPAHGAWGATLALCGGIVALPMLQAWQARRLLGLNSTILAKARA